MSLAAKMTVLVNDLGSAYSSSVYPVQAWLASALNNLQIAGQAAWYAASEGAQAQQEYNYACRA
jgi:hypothetical protein